MKILIFIPARGGSKGIKNKNLIKIGNKKLIDYTLDIALNINKNFKIFLSTDNLSIIDHCKKKGLVTKYRRPKYLSGDKSNIIDAVNHGLKWLKQKK